MSHNRCDMRMIQKIKEVFDKWELVRYLISTDMKVEYKNKVFGFLWSLLDPLCMMGVYIILVVVIFQRGGPRFPILLFSALLAWRWFTSSVSGSVTAVTSRAKLIQTIYFPKAIFPLSKVLGKFLDYLFGLAVLIPLLFIFEARVSVYTLWMPVIILIQLILTLGICLYIAWAGIYFKDIQNILHFALRALFYLSPALYIAQDRVPPSFIPFYMLNPFAALFTAYKNILVLGQPPPYQYLLITFVLGVGLTVLGFNFFIRQEAKFARDV